MDHQYAAPTIERIADDALARAKRADAHVPTIEIIARKLHGMASQARNGSNLDATDSLGYHLRLVLDNDQYTYERVRELTREHLDARDDCPVCDGRGIYPDGRGDLCAHCEGRGERERYPHQLGDQLKDLAEELSGLELGGPGGQEIENLLAREILSTALAWIDWREIAEHYIAAEIENREYEAERA